MLKNLHLTFVLCRASQKHGEDFPKFCGLLRTYELCMIKKYQVDKYARAKYQHVNNIFHAFTSTFMMMCMLRAILISISAVCILANYESILRLQDWIGM